MTERPFPGNAHRRAWLHDQGFHGTACVRAADPAGGDRACLLRSP